MTLLRWLVYVAVLPFCVVFVALAMALLVILLLVGDHLDPERGAL